MIRVMQVIPTLDQGGAEKQLTLLATRLPRDQFEVTVCTLTRLGPYAKQLEAAQIPLINVGKKWKLDPAAWLRLRNHIRRIAPDIVHTWLFAANSYGRKAAHSAKVPHIVAAERCVDQWKVGYELAIDRHLARKTDRLVANSAGVVDFYAGHGIPRDLFAVIPNGIEAHDTVPWDRGELLKELNLPDDTWLIGAVGRLWPQKRYKDLIWAAQLLKAAETRAHLLIIGEGPLQSRLERYRDLVEMSDRVHFLGHRADVARLLPVLDCFWLASGFEGQSNAVMEAMLAELPVVASDIPGNRELVVEGQTGYLVPVGDRAEFASKTLELIESRDLCRQFGAAGRARMLSEFSVDKMVQSHAALYQAIMGND